MASMAVVTGDVIAGAAVLASLSGYLHEWASTVAATMAVIYYVWQFGTYLYRCYRSKKRG